MHMLKQPPPLSPHAQAYELSEFVRWVSKSTDCWVLGGDLNLKPWDLGFRIILANGG